MTLNRLSGPSFSSEKLSPFQSQVDGLVGRFVKEAADPITLTTLTGASLTYRLARWASAGRVWSVPFAFSAELATFEFGGRTLHAIRATGPSPLQEGSFRAHFPRKGGETSPLQLENPNLWSWTGVGGIFQGLLTSGITLGMLKGGGFFVRDQNLILQHLFQGAAMVLGHQSAGTLGLTPKPQGSWPEQFLQAEATILQLSAGMGLAHHLAPGLPFFEKGLDFSRVWKEDLSEKTTSLPFGAPPVFAEGFHGSLALRSTRHPRFLPEIHQAKMSSLEGHGPFLGFKGSVSLPQSRFLSRSEAYSLEARFKNHFPPQSYNNYSKLIITKALEIPFRTSRFHEVFLKILSEKPRAGSEEQLVTVKAVKSLLDFDPLRTGTGSFDNLRLYWILENLFTAKGRGREGEILSDILDAMENGTLPEKTDSLFKELDPEEALRPPTHPIYSPEFWQRHHREAARAWKGYQEQDVILLFNFVFSLAAENPSLASRVIKIIGQGRVSGAYSDQDIEGALNFAREHPQGMLVLYRLFQIFAVEDLPAKLKELRPFSSAVGYDAILRQHLQGVPFELIAESINGTYLTAFIDDLRLARKIVSVFLEVAPYLTDPSLRLASRVNFESKALDFILSGKKITPKRLFKLLQVNPSDPIESLERAWRAGRLLIEVLSDHEMDAKLKNWEDGAGLNCYFQELEPKARDRIYLREMPSLKLQNQRDKNQAYFALLLRLFGVVHEGEHWRHFSENYWGMEQGGRRIVLANIGRENLILSEIMAYLETERWKSRNYTIENWEIAARLGQVLPLYLRDHVDYHYSQRVGAGILSRLFESALP